MQHRGRLKSSARVSFTVRNVAFVSGFFTLCDLCLGMNGEPYTNDQHNYGHKAVITLLNISAILSAFAKL